MRNYLVVIFSLFYSFVFADTVIQMEEYGGVYRVPCTVNGAKMKFIFDTGASNLCLSLSMAEYLLDNGYIETSDIIGTGSSTVADGRIVDHVKLIIKDIQIGDFHIRNVESIVVEGQNAPLLFGQSAIKKLGNYEIQGSLLIIHNDASITSNNVVSDIRQKLSNAIEGSNYDQALTFFEQLFSMNQLSSHEKYQYASYLFMNNDYKKAITVLDKVENRSELIANGDDIYRLYADIYFCMSDYKKSIMFSDLSNKYLKNDSFGLSNNYYNMGQCCYFQEFYEQAAEYYFNALKYYAKGFNVDFDYIFRDCTNQLDKKEKSYRNDRIDDIFYHFVICSERSGKMSTDLLIEIIQDLAKAKNRYAQKLLNDMKTH